MCKPDFFDRIDAAIEPQKKRFFSTKLAQSMVAGTVPVEAYKGYLRETYHFTRHTSRFLAAAASRFGDEYEPIRKRFMKHTLEEYGHDRFALDDLKALGVDPCEVQASEPLVATQAMIAWHYYMAERLNPVAMFGLIYVFEGLGQGEGGEAARALARNLPPKALTFLAKHAHLDVKHLEEARATMRKHVHSEEDERSIIYAARAALELYTFMFEQIWARYEASARGGAPAEVGAAEGVLVA